MVSWCCPISASIVPMVCRRVCQPTPMIPVLLNAGSIFFFSTDAKSSGLRPLSLSEGDVVPRLVVKALVSPLQQAIFERRMHRHRLRRSLRLGIDQMPSPTPIIGMLDVEDVVEEIAIHPAECAQFASTCPETRIQEHQELIAKFELGQNMRHLFCRQFQRRLLMLGTDPYARAWASLAPASGRYSRRDRIVAPRLQRTACENSPDMTHLILALVPSATSVARSQRSTSTTLTCSNCILPQRGISQFFAYVMYESCVDSALTGSPSRK